MMAEPKNRITHSNGSHLAIWLTIMFAIWCALLPLQTERARAEPHSTPASDKSLDSKMPDAKVEADIRAAQMAIAADPAAEGPVRTLVDLLARAGRQREALTEADRVVKRGSPTAALLAQRGFLRRQLNNPHGAAEDFADALFGEGLTQDQRRNVEAGLAEAKAAEALGELDRAQNDLARGNFVQAAEQARIMLERDPNSESAMRIRVEALAGGGQKREALEEADRVVASGTANTLLRAERRLLSRGLE